MDHYCFSYPWKHPSPFFDDSNFGKIIPFPTLSHCGLERGRSWWIQDQQVPMNVFCCCGRDKLTEEAELRKDVLGWGWGILSQAKPYAIGDYAWSQNTPRLFSYVSQNILCGLRYFELSLVSYGQESSIELAGHGVLWCRFLNVQLAKLRKGGSRKDPPVPGWRIGSTCDMVIKNLSERSQTPALQGRSFRGLDWCMSGISKIWAPCSFYKCSKETDMLILNLGLCRSNEEEITVWLKDAFSASSQET